MSSLFNYGTEGVYIGGPSPLSAAFEAVCLAPLQSIQSSSITLNYPRQDTDDWAGGGEPLLVVRPRAQLDLTYVYSSGLNEGLLGFQINGLVPALLNLNAERNVYVMANLDHHDLVGYVGQNSVVMGVGNTVVNRYSFQAGVGQLSTVSVGFEGLNLMIQSGSAGTLPSVNKQAGSYPTGLYSLPVFTQSVGNCFDAMPSAIELSFASGSAIGAALSGANACPIQSFAFSIDLTREDVGDLGWFYPKVRPIKWPVTISIRADAYLNGFQLDTLNRFTCPDSGFAFSVAFQNSCVGSDGFAFQFNDARLDSEVITTSVGGGSTRVSFNWSTKIYDINRVSGANLFMGTVAAQTAYTGIVLQQVSYGTGVAQLPLILDLSAPSYLSVISGPGFLSGNNLFLSDEDAQTVVQANQSGATWSFQDLSFNVGG